MMNGFLSEWHLQTGYWCIDNLRFCSTYIAMLIFYNLIHIFFNNFWYKICKMYVDLNSLIVTIWLCLSLMSSSVLLS